MIRESREERGDHETTPQVVKARYVLGCFLSKPEN